MDRLARRLISSLLVSAAQGSPACLLTISVRRFPDVGPQQRFHFGRPRLRSSQGVACCGLCATGGFSIEHFTYLIAAATFVVFWLSGSYPTEIWSRGDTQFTIYFNHIIALVNSRFRLAIAADFAIQCVSFWQLSGAADSGMQPTEQDGVLRWGQRTTNERMSQDLRSGVTLRVLRKASAHRERRATAVARTER
jgi:hypothetical protein